ncbi:copper-binding protein [Massilia norwichensis]|jgi:Cu(I)/Ag(I) efflux system protein CusF|uniref:Copper-binding protein n=1 Tax=Massilia norwichensis TaxID=1442366 RepID=A0ABT2A2E5_9BURK|nr:MULTISPECIES: copper-binding protein [Massilia]MCS0588346.1 copper-binding protein [Massilia norwichensis]MDN4054290.1 copper-binding protein [Massilia sp. YIM B02763]
MKRFAQLAFISALTISGTAFGQTGDMKGMEMKKGCMDMKDMKGMDMNNMKGMNMEGCKEMMKENTADSKVQGTSKEGTVHKTSAVVKSVDPANGKVTLAHDQVKTLNWPAMTMTFGVKDKSLLDKLAVGKKVDVEFTQQGSNYVVSAVK